jgi:pyruvate, water dikinase
MARTPLAAFFNRPNIKRNFIGMKPPASTPESYILWFEEIGLQDISRVGGKNASLGEMYCELTPQGVRIPNGFAITAEAYRYVLREAGLDTKIQQILGDLDTGICPTSVNEGDKSDKRLLLQPFLQNWNRP